MSQSLIIVESPSKARTIKKYLGKGFDVKASVGHIRDLPSSELGVDVDKEFKPKYVTIKGKEKVIAELRKAAGEADQVYLAPDPDREGEAIAWHIAQSIKGQNTSIKRALFNEITPSGITEGIEQARAIDANLFASQQARRILDRLVGYKLSPLLWNKVKRGLSAGRVQSVAVRLVVERELEIEAFVPDEYWDIFVDLNAEQPPTLRVKLAKKNDARCKITDEQSATEVVDFLKTNPYAVQDILIKAVSRKAQPPFITSTLQQMSASQLRMAPKRTMRIAQQLYEGVKLGKEGPVGLITYMRTDSFRMAGEAVSACRTHIENKFGAQYLPAKPAAYKTRKGAQDAHEAIRPTSMDNSPESIKSFLTNEQYRLYRLIWNRFVACQMAPAKYEQTTVLVDCGPYQLNATSNVEVFPGHLRVARENRSDSNDSEDKSGDETVPDKLPPLAKGDALTLEAVDPNQKFTQPPNRFSESALIREMEEKGIGRPSTYASIITVIQDKEYVQKVTGYLRPTDLGRSVTRLLITSFPNVMDVSFTAQMEQNLDGVEDGKNDPQDLLQVFWQDFSNKLETAAKDMQNIKQTGEPTDIICDKCGKPMVIKYGRNGPFLACADNKECKTIKNFVRDENNTVVVVEDEMTDETCEKCGSGMIRKQGRWGPYLACSGYPNCKNTISLNKKGEKVSKTKAEPDPNVKCPQCEAPMILRTSRYGNRFHACSTYPKCKGTRPFETDVSCPVDSCKGHLVEQLSRKKPKRPFWGCSNYPDCEFVTGDEPINRACKKCGHTMMVKRAKDGVTFCPKCETEETVE